MPRYHLRRILGLVTVCGLFLATAVPAEPVKLAVLLPLSGSWKVEGLSAQQGFLLGLQAEAAAQNVDWKSWITLEFLDTRLDPVRSLQLAKDAIAGGAQAILGGSSSGVCVTIRDYVLDAAGVPFVVLGCAAQQLRTHHPLFLRLSYSQPLLSTALARWLIEHPLVAAEQPWWVCIHADFVGGVGFCDGFQATYAQVGEEIGRIPVPLKTLNKKKAIVQLAKLKPDFAVAVFIGAEAEVFVRDYYRFQVHQTIPLVAFSAAVSPARLRAYERSLEQYGTAVGIVTAADYDAVVANPVNQRFVAEYQQAYETEPVLGGVWGYDAGRLLIKALAQLHGKWDGPQVVQLMKTVPHTSPRHGQPLRFDTHGDTISPVYILQTKRAGKRLVNEIIGQLPPINMDEVLR